MAIFSESRLNPLVTRDNDATAPTSLMNIRLLARNHALYVIYIQHGGTRLLLLRYELGYKGALRESRIYIRHGPPRAVSSTTTMINFSI